MWRAIMATAALAGVLLAVSGAGAPAAEWSARDLGSLRSLWIGSLPKLAPDPSNAVGDDPRAARLGQRIFFDKRFSADGSVACATCHQPERRFTDGLALAKGLAMTASNTPTIIGAAYSPWFFWDGRADSQWSQALGPLENPAEHGGSRSQYAKLIFTDRGYRRAYEELFGAMGDVAGANGGPAATRLFVNMGKAVAAYERLLTPGPSRFDGYVESLLNSDGKAGRGFTPDEAAGLRLFIGQGKGQGNCIHCHNGPLLTNNEFHNIGLPVSDPKPEDDGRAAGAKAVRASPFNCLSPHSDAKPGDCRELDFIKHQGPEIAGAFKAPTLRNVGLTGPYMHDGRFASLQEVLAHYNQAPDADVGVSGLVPLGLAPGQLEQLRRFLLSLDSPPRVPPALLAAPQ